MLEAAPERVGTAMAAAAQAQVLGRDTEQISTLRR